MQISTRTRAALATLIIVGAVAPAAVASGEPKNEWPFTRPVAARTTAQVNQSAQPASGGISGEPKNEPPFTQPITTPTVVVRSGFDWADAGVGAAGAIGLVSIVLGGAVLTSSNRRRRIAGTFE